MLILLMQLMLLHGVSTMGKSDEGIKHFSGLVSLKDLDISNNCNISDEGIKLMSFFAGETSYTKV